MKKMFNLNYSVTNGGTTIDAAYINGSIHVQTDTLTNAGETIACLRELLQIGSQLGANHLVVYLDRFDVPFEEIVAWLDAHTDAAVVWTDRRFSQYAVPCEKRSSPRG